MKELAKIEQPIGDSGGVVSGAVSVDENFLSAKVEVKYPTSKIVEPAFAALDQFADKIEALIPGDQKAMAEQAKKDARALVMKMIAEQTQA